MRITTPFFFHKNCKLYNGINYFKEENYMNVIETVLDSKWMRKRSFKFQNRIMNLFAKFLCLKTIVSEFFDRRVIKLPADNKEAE